METTINDVYESLMGAVDDAFLAANRASSDEFVTRDEEMALWFAYDEACDNLTAFEQANGLGEWF